MGSIAILVGFDQLQRLLVFVRAFRGAVENFGGFKILFEGDFLAFGAFDLVTLGFQGGAFGFRQWAVFGNRLVDVFLVQCALFSQQRLEVIIGFGHASASRK